MSYYLFSNHEKLSGLAKAKKFDELLEELHKTEMIKISDYHGVNPSAKEVYRNICYCIAESNKKEILKDICKCVENMFVEKKDVKALLMIYGDMNIYGTLSAKACSIVKEFENYRSVALAIYNENSPLKSFEKKYEAITVKYSSGRLSFIWDDEEYVIFFGGEL